MPRGGWRLPPPSPSPPPRIRPPPPRTSPGDRTRWTGRVGTPSAAPAVAGGPDAERLPQAPAQAADLAPLHELVDVAEDRRVTPVVDRDEDPSGFRRQPPHGVQLLERGHQRVLAEGGRAAAGRPRH